MSTNYYGLRELFRDRGPGSGMALLSPGAPVVLPSPEQADAFAAMVQRAEAEYADAQVQPQQGEEMTEQWLTNEENKRLHAAQAATPGPWDIVHVRAAMDGHHLRTERRGLARDELNYRHIAASDPTAVIATLEEVARLRAALHVGRRAVDGARAALAAVTVGLARRTDERDDARNDAERRRRDRADLVVEFNRLTVARSTQMGVEMKLEADIVQLCAERDEAQDLVRRADLIVAKLLCGGARRDGEDIGAGIDDSRKLELAAWDQDFEGRKP